MKLPADVLFRKDLSLMVWKPQGILDQALLNDHQALVNEIVALSKRPRSCRLVKAHGSRQAS